MISVAAALLVPLVLAATVVPLVAGWEMYRAFKLMLGSDLSLSIAIGRDVIVVGTMLAIIGLKLAAPALILDTWPRQKVPAIVFSLAWLGALAACATTVALAARATLALLDSSPAYLVAFVATWLSFDAIVCLLPAALALARGSSKPNDAATRQETVATCTPCIDVHSPAAQTVPRRLGKDDVLAALLASVDAGAPDAAGRTIVMTQGGIAKQLGMPKGTVNRHLHQLHDEGHIELVTSATKTKITVLRRGGIAGAAVTSGPS